MTVTERIRTLLHDQGKRVNQMAMFLQIRPKNIDLIKKDVVLKNHNATVRFVDSSDAIEYRETLRKSTGISYLRRRLQ